MPYNQRVKRFLKFLPWGIALVILALAAVRFFMLSATEDYIVASIDDAPAADVALILGASVYSSGELTSVFRARVEKALEVYRAGKVGNILVSGDNSTPWHNEVQPVRKYLLQKGVPEGDIYLDYAGFDTYSSMYRARDVFGVRSMIVTTQTFHLPRALFLARRLGIAAYGVPADIPYLYARNHAREVLAQAKAVIDLIVSREPKFLGEKIVIE